MPENCCPVKRRTTSIPETKLLTPHVGERIGCRLCRERLTVYGSGMSWHSRVKAIMLRSPLREQLSPALDQLTVSRHKFRHSDQELTAIARCHSLRGVNHPEFHAPSGWFTNAVSAGRITPAEIDCRSASQSIVRQKQHQLDLPLRGKQFRASRSGNARRTTNNPLESWAPRRP
jgi:hypothetical protein